MTLRKKLTVFAAVFMLIAAFLLGYDYKNALYVFKRDRFKHKSPNSAQTESVCAGALDVMLGGDAYYFGKIVKKDTIGININIRIDDIKQIQLLVACNPKEHVRMMLKTIINIITSGIIFRIHAIKSITIIFENVK